MSTVAAAPVRRPLLRMMKLGHPVRLSLLLAVVAGAATAAAGIALLGVSGFLLARAAQHPNLVALSIAVVAVRALGITRGLARYVERLASHDAALRVLADLRGSVYAKLEQLTPAGLGRLRGGDMLTRFVADVDAVQDLFIRGVTPPLVAVAAGSGAVLLTAVLWPPAAAVLAGGLVVAGLVLPAISAALANRGTDAALAARADLAVGIVDLVDGAAELVALGAGEELIGRLGAADATLTRQARRGAAISALGTGAGTLVSGITTFGVLVLSVGAVSHGALGTVPLAVLILTALAAFEVTAALPGAAIALVNVRGSARRIFAILDAPLPVDEPDAAEAVKLPRCPLSIALRGVTATYPDRDEAVLRGLDLDLRAGQRLAVVGPSGSGKSTLAAVLLRLLDFQAGEYRLNGVDARTVAGDDVRRTIGGCLADAHIFDSTVRANLQLACPEAEDTDLLRALAMVRLESWLSTLPNGLDTPLGAHGLTMSGGQRQRLAVARALLAGPDLVVLDEPTAHLDTETAEALMTDLLAALHDRAVLLITHDRRTLADMDDVYELRDGRLHRTGP